MWTRVEIPFSLAPEPPVDAPTPIIDADDTLWKKSYFERAFDGSWSFGAFSMTPRRCESTDEIGTPNSKSGYARKMRPNLRLSTSTGERSWMTATGPSLSFADGFWSAHGK